MLAPFTFLKYYTILKQICGNIFWTDEELYCDHYDKSHHSEKSDICGCEICEISAFDMGVAAAYLPVGYKACHGGNKSAKAAYVRSYYKCVQLVGEA